MKKFIEKIKPTVKVIGIIFGIFILWIVFNLITNKNTDRNYNLQENSKINLPMMASKGMDFTEDSIKMKRMPSNESNYNQSAPTLQATNTLAVEKKVIKNGNLSLKVDHTETAAEEINVIAKNQTGEVFSTNFYERVKGQKNGSITVKVPVEKFEATLIQIKAVATQVISESTTGQNVTEKYSDLQAQLRNKKAEEQSFVKILDRAGDIKDVLAVTQQISRVRGEVERLEGQIGFMDSQTNMSTIVIALSEDIEITPIQNNWRPWQVTKKAFSDLISNSQNFIDSTIQFIIVGVPSLIPFLLFLGVIYWIGKKIWRKIRS